MKRYLLSDLIGDGTEDNPYRPAIADTGVNHVAEFPPQDMTTGQYAGTTCLVKVAAPKLGQLQADPRNDFLPDFPLDGRLSAIQSGLVQAMEQAVTRRGLTFGFSQSAGYRDVIRGIGRQLNPAFHEDSFDISE